MIRWLRELFARIFGKKVAVIGKVAATIVVRLNARSHHGDQIGTDTVWFAAF